MYLRTPSSKGYRPVINEGEEECSEIISRCKARTEITKTVHILCSTNKLSSYLLLIKKNECNVCDFDLTTADSMGASVAEDRTGFATLT